jgi:hypothetical protein
LRREINEGLNVVEQWNGATDFVFFARRGEMVSNRPEDHEISMLALHLIQNCMVYINTLMIQKVLAQSRRYQTVTLPSYDSSDLSSRLKYARKASISSRTHPTKWDACIGSSNFAEK